MASQGDGQQPSVSVACPHLHHVELAEGYIRMTGKGRKERVVPLGRAATERLQRYLEEARPALLKGVPPRFKELRRLDRRPTRPRARRLGTSNSLSTGFESPPVPPSSTALSTAQEVTDPEAERVAVEVYLTNPGTEPWTAAGAVLRGPKGEVLKPLLFWQTLGNVTFPE